jgi:hypothetical protein
MAIEYDEVAICAAKRWRTKQGMRVKNYFLVTHQKVLSF